jgi:DNA-binding MurR/RpiR family transcriptional regulator
MTADRSDLGHGSADDRFVARLAGRPSAETLVRRLVAAEDGHLVSTLGQVAEDGALPVAAGLVVAARRRYVTGTGKSLAFATLLATDLAVSCSHVHLIDDATVPALDVLAEVSSTDVLVAFSFRRYRRETAALATAFAAAGGTLIAITDSADAPLAKSAAVTIVVDTGSASFVDSPTAVVAVSHILATLVGASAKGARRRIATRDRLATDLGLYLTGDAHPDLSKED